MSRQCEPHAQVGVRLAPKESTLCKSKGSWSRYPGNSWGRLLAALNLRCHARPSARARSNFALSVVPGTEMVYHESQPPGEQPMPEATLDQRMTAMEEAVRELQEVLKARKPSLDWLDRVIGSMKDEPAFDEVLAYGRAIRQADRPAEDEAP
jgi:hypothetical protein